MSDSPEPSYRAQQIFRHWIDIDTTTWVRVNWSLSKYSTKTALRWCLQSSITASCMILWSQDQHISIFQQYAAESGASQIKDSELQRGKKILEHIHWFAAFTTAKRLEFWLCVFITIKMHKDIKKIRILKELCTTFYDSEFEQHADGWAGG